MALPAPSDTVTLGLTALWTTVCTVALMHWFRAVRRVRTNYKGISIPSSLGLAIVVGAAPLLTAHAVTGCAWSRTFLFVLCAFATLGLIDDIWGGPGAKGLKGHALKLVREHRVTSGLLKAVGGLVSAYVAATLFLDEDPWAALVSTLIIALSANAANLLDLRPGRAGAACLLVGSITVALLAASGRYPAAAALACVLTAAAVVYIPDSRARAMLGDTGSNALGACVGIGLVVVATDMAQRLAILAALAGLHVVAERWSLSAIIERFGPLRALDRLTGVR